MKITAKEIAELVHGTVEGNPETEVNQVSKIEEGKPGTLSFLANPQYKHYLYTTESSIILINKEFKLEKPVSTTLIRVDDAYSCLAKLLALYESSKPQKQGIHPSVVIGKDVNQGQGIYIGANTCIGENCQLGENVKIYPNCCIGDNVSIGDNTTLNPGVIIYDNCQIGVACMIHAGTIIGSDGFGFAPSAENNYEKVPQIGNVIIEDHVEIGANTTIDRATMGSTIIRKGVKLDNLIQIAHNVEVGENTVIAAQTGIAGSTKIGKNCMLAGQVGVTGHVTIADNTKVAAQTGIASSIKKPDTVLQGSPAYELSLYQRSYVMFRKLPDFFRRLNDLEKKLDKS